MVTVKFALDWPEATFTEVGTEAREVLALERLKVTPFDPAIEERLTVPREVLPPVTLVGETESEVRFGVLIERVEFTGTPLKVPVICTLVAVFTAFVVTPKVALFLPAGIVTVAGTVAAAVLPLASFTTAPDEPAFP